MKTDSVIRLFGTQTAVADFLGLTKSAVNQWGEDVPRLRVYELREKRPTIDAELAAMNNDCAA